MSYIPPHRRIKPDVPKTEASAVTDENMQSDLKEAVLERMRVDNQVYERRWGQVTNHQVISEYSVTIDREVKNDRSNAGYLVEENIRDGVCFDLAKGLNTFIDKGKMLENEPCLHPLCKWAIAQSGATIKEVFDGADIACWRGTLKRIATTLLKPKDGWTVVAQDFGGVILISEQARKYYGGRHDLATYTGFKFEQYMTADKPNGRPDADSPLDNRATFEMMVRSELIDGGMAIKLCCGAEIDAIRGGSEFEPVELKTGWNAGAFRHAVTVMQSELVGVKTIVAGFKSGDISKMDVKVHKVVEKRVSDIKTEYNLSEKVGQGYSFLFDVLTRVKRFIVGHEACEVTYDPYRRELVFKKSSRKNAKGKGNGVTDEFLARFNLFQ